GQNAAQLSDKALQERAKLLHNMGEDDEKRGDLTSAQRNFDEAARNTGLLLAKVPQDPQRIFDQAQSEYWVGFVAWRREDWAAARSHFEAYAKLADRLVQSDPTNDTWLMEVSYAATNLGMVTLRQAGRPDEARRQFQKALEIERGVAEHKPDDPKLQREIAKALAWIADAERLGGDLHGALAARREQRAILAGLLAKTPNSLAIRKALLDQELAVARIEIAQGKFLEAEKRLDRGRAAGLELARADPDNKDIPKETRMFELFTVKAWLAEPANSRPPVRQITDRLGDCKATEASLATEEINDFCNVLLARVREVAGDHIGARIALSSVSPHSAAQRNVLTAHWGLNLSEEAGAMQLAAVGAKTR
ncbi:MAG TPA: hypothetical protein VGQ34_11090, partial [Sphingomicrobium sp.]|nr:hypothetical protein [Sphingomicrobium sp.]